MFLVYTPLHEMTAVTAQQLAVDMAIAAISSAKIYNFGEVLSTPILSVLANTQDSWLQDIVELLNKGAVQEIDALLSRHSDALAASPLAQAIPTILMKAQLLSFVNLAFEKSSNDRIIPFQDIATRSRVALEQVEWLLMKAMSLELVKGTIDEVAQVVSVTWIQPRVLNVQQLASVEEQVGIWREK
jgi:26S proteasome regulatory subunit N9